MTGWARASAARAAASLAFGPGALGYHLLTGHAAWRADCRRMAALLAAAGAARGRVLDLGIGPGTSALEMARAAPGLRLVGLDRAGAMLRLARRAGRRAAVPLPLVQADALALPFAAGSFDAATGHSFLYLLPDPAAALAEVRRVLRPGGPVVFLEPRAGPTRLARALRRGPRCAASMVLWRGMAQLHRRFDGDGLAALLRGAGFTAVRAAPVLYGYGLVVTGATPG